MQGGCAGMRVTLGFYAQRKIRSLCDRPQEWRSPGCCGREIDRDMPAATSREAFEQAMQDPAAGGVVIADVVHQLPALLADLEMSRGFADPGDIVLRREQRGQQRRAFPRATVSRGQRLRHIV